MMHFGSCKIEKTIKSGKKTEIYTFHAPSPHKPRGPRRNVHNDAQYKKNLRAATIKIERLVNQNFSDADLAVVFTYADLSILRCGMPPDLSTEEESKYMYAAAQKELQKFFDRLRRACVRANVPLRYIAITSDYDIDEAKPTRIHHHLIINCETRDYLCDAWGIRGLVKIGKIYPNHDKFPLASYFLNQSRHFWGKRSFVSSRNLQQPFVTCRPTLSDEPPPPPPDAYGIELTNRKISYYQP